MSKEIEVRIQIDEHFLSNVKEWLDKNAKYAGNIHHVEYYLNKPETTFMFTAPEGYRDANDFFRVRFTNEGDSICLKKFHEDPIEKRPIYCDEYEIEVSDGKKTLELMRALGYTEHTLVDKNRETYVFGSFEIVLDRVKDVGIFIEVELKKEVENPREGLQEIYRFLKSMGITKFTLQQRGYVSMLWNPHYNFGRKVEL